jgi:hypothetical protein
MKNIFFLSTFLFFSCGQGNETPGDGADDGPAVETVDGQDSTHDAVDVRADEETMEAAGDGPVGEHWWEKPNLRVVTYEFLERRTRDTDLAVDEIMSAIQQLGGADVLLGKAFQYYGGAFDDSSWGLPRFQGKIAEIVPVAHGADIKVGVFGFVDRTKTYAGQEDYDRVVGVWGDYAAMGVDALFIDEESGTSGTDIPAECLTYCDDLKTRFGLPVGIFIYGGASESGRVREIAAHVDILGEMGYNLYLDQMGDYNLAYLTETWVSAAREARPEIAYWTGAGIFDESRFPGTPFWQERYGTRTISQYFYDYMNTGIQSGATGVFFHSICRLEWWTPDVRQQVVDGVHQIFTEL